MVSWLDLVGWCAAVGIGPPVLWLGIVVTNWRLTSAGHALRRLNARVAKVDGGEEEEVSELTPLRAARFRGGR